MGDTTMMDIDTVSEKTEQDSEPTAFEHAESSSAAVQELIYYPTEPGSLGMLLRYILEVPGDALAIREIVLDTELDGAGKSGVLEFAAEYGAVSESENKGEGEGEGIKLEPGTDEDELAKGIESVAINPSTMPTYLSQDSTAATSSLLSSTGIESIIQTACEDFHALKQASCIESDDEIPEKLYLGLLACLLAVCKNVEILRLPEKWYDSFEGKFPKLLVCTIQG